MTEGDTSTPETTPAPARRSRAALWVTLGLVALIAIGAVGYFGYQQYQASLEQARQDRVKAQAAAIDKELEQVWLAAVRVDADWDALSSADDVTKLKPLADETASTATSLSATVKELRTQAKAIESTSVAKQYDSILNSVQNVLDNAVASNSDTGQTVTQAKQTARAKKAAEKGWDLVNDSVKSCNSRKFSKGLKQAQDARKELQTAQAAFIAVKKAGDNDGQESVDWAREVIVLAKLQETLARLGSQGSIGGYNRQIDKLNAQQAKIDALDARPFLTEDYLADQVRGSNGRLEESLKSAKERWDDVRLVVASGTF